MDGDWMQCWRLLKCLSNLGFDYFPGLTDKLQRVHNNIKVIKKYE